MRFSLALISLVSFAGLASAQTGYGRFPCSIVNGDGTFSPDPTQCEEANLVNPGSNTADTGIQGDRPNPISPVCVQQLETGAYFCGSAGASCFDDTNCDGGRCAGVFPATSCQGGFTQACAGNDNNCLGFLYCLAGDFSVTPSNTCGGLGAFCQDPTQGDASLSNAENYAIFNAFCSSGYCSFGSAICLEHVTTVGQSCQDDPDFACTQTSTGQALTCRQTDFTCQLAARPSARARTRRSDTVLARRNLCPAESHQACRVEGTDSFKCIDTSSSLESCGGCLTDLTGVDCTAIEGAEQVGCVQGTCEIWSCADGYTFDSNSQVCVKI
ncbi:hypothetical protein JCM5353_007547 [Sporobolomyces roseus]